jgi:hypothetical protein
MRACTCVRVYVRVHAVANITPVHQLLQPEAAPDTWSGTVVFVLSVAGSFALTAIAYINPSMKWHSLRSLACQLESVLWLYRTRVGDFAVSGRLPRSPSCASHYDCCAYDLYIWLLRLCCHVHRHRRRQCPGDALHGPALVAQRRLVHGGPQRVRALPGVPAARVHAPPTRGRPAVPRPGRPLLAREAGRLHRTPLAADQALLPGVSTGCPPVLRALSSRGLSSSMPAHS